MKREIKFRAWDGIKMILPEYTDWKDYHIQLDGEKHEVTFSGYYDTPSIIYKDEDILMQYTGLKDKNGVEIYEGDIIKKDNGVWGVIVWKAPFFEVTVSETQSSVYTKEWIEDSEVIGNIYEHPHLLTPSQVNELK